jgi:hypothetical protein
VQREWHLTTATASHSDGFTCSASRRGGSMAGSKGRVLGQGQGRAVRLGRVPVQGVTGLPVT